jgi:hypothetical protein
LCEEDEEEKKSFDEELKALQGSFRQSRPGVVRV